jgi:hypothetical protein
LTQVVGVAGRQVDLVLLVTQAEPDRLVGRTTVKIVGHVEYASLRHRAPPRNYHEGYNKPMKPPAVQRPGVRQPTD